MCGGAALDLFISAEGRPNVGKLEERISQRVLNVRRQHRPCVRRVWQFEYRQAHLNVDCFVVEVTGDEGW